MADDIVTEAQTYARAAATALAGRDYATALDNALAAQALLACAPAELERSSGHASGSRRLRIAAEAVERLVVRIRQQQASSRGIQTINKVYQPAIPDLNW